MKIAPKSGLAVSEFSSMGTYVQYGCGLCAPEGWINFDASYTLAFERLPLIGRFYTKNERRFPAGVRYGDIVKGLPLPGGSVDGVYASHVLEHLAYDDCLRAIGNTYRLLRPGGVFRLVVPDLEAAAKEYLAQAEKGSTRAAELFMENTALGRRRRPRGLKALVHSMFNSSAHLWMWDRASMQAALESQGFRNVRRCRFNDSADTNFSLVEDANRFEGALALEALRPPA